MKNTTTSTREGVALWRVLGDGLHRVQARETKKFYIDQYGNRIEKTLIGGKLGQYQYTQESALDAAIEWSLNEISKAQDRIALMKEHLDMLTKCKNELKAPDENEEQAVEETC